MGGLGAFGGDLGWMPINELPMSLITAIDSMKVGELNGPVLSEFGYHILRLDDRYESSIPDLEEIRDAGLYDEIWQAFAVLLPVHSVGVMGDFRTYENVIALRAVTSRDGMTADWYPFPHEVLGRISARIINEVPGVNRVTYDVST